MAPLQTTLQTAQPDLADFFDHLPFIPSRISPRRDRVSIEAVISVTPRLNTLQPDIEDLVKAYTLISDFKYGVRPTATQRASFLRDTPPQSDPFTTKRANEKPSLGVTVVPGRPRNCAHMGRLSAKCRFHTELK